MDTLDRPSLALIPVDLNRHANDCITFLRDSFKCSFGGSVEWERTFGADGSGYWDWLHSYSGTMFHAWRGDRIVGELMFEPAEGYLQHIYVVPSLRGQGVGRWLHEEFVRLLLLHGKHEASLKVSRANYSAVGFYTHLGWQRIRRDCRDAKLDVLHLDCDLQRVLILSENK